MPTEDRDREKAHDIYRKVARDDPDALRMLMETGSWERDKLVRFTVTLLSSVLHRVKKEFRSDVGRELLGRALESVKRTETIAKDLIRVPCLVCERNNVLQLPEDKSVPTCPECLLGHANEGSVPGPGPVATGG